MYKGIRRGIDDGEEKKKMKEGDDDGAQAPVCVCEDCCGRIGGTLAGAFRTHLELGKGLEGLVKIGANSLKDVTFDDFKGKPIEMEIGCAWKNEDESNELRA